MATKKLNINLQKPISVESQMALVEYARQHRTQMLNGISEWLNEKVSLCNRDSSQQAWWYEDDAHSMMDILFNADSGCSWLGYRELDTIVRDWFIDIASGVYESEQESDEPVLKTYRIHYTLNGYVEIEAESEDIARELLYDSEYDEWVWDSVSKNELVIMDSEEVTA